MSDEQPVNDEHIAFARAVVALARKHGANRLKVEFNLSGDRRFFEDRCNWQTVTFDWSEGRHGDQANIGLRAEARIGVSEGEDNPHG